MSNSPEYVAKNSEHGGLWQLIWQFMSNHVDSGDLAWPHFFAGHLDGVAKNSFPFGAPVKRQLADCQGVAMIEVGFFSRNCSPFWPKSWETGEEIVDRRSNRLCGCELRRKSGWRINRRAAKSTRYARSLTV